MLKTNPMEGQIKMVQVLEQPTPVEKMASNATSTDKRYVIAYRYTTLHRIQHLVNLVVMNLLFITGLEIFLGKFPFGGFELTHNVNVFLGFFIAYWSVYTYLVIVASEKKLREIIPTPRDLLDLAIILLCAVNILPDSKYPHYDFYDPVKKKYAMKYHPTQKLLGFGNLIMLIVISISGFALYEQVSPGTIGIVGTTATDILNPILDLFGITLRFLHFLIFAYFLMSTTIHVYFTMLPENRGRLHGMMIGGEKIYIE
jgi:cytochrome b subunit of formate dehydrogenase